MLPSINLLDWPHLNYTEIDTQILVHVGPSYWEMWTKMSGIHPINHMPMSLHTTHLLQRTFLGIITKDQRILPSIT